MSRRYAIASLDEARAYLAHPVLGPRLLDCTRALAELDGERTAPEIMGDVDAAKLRSAMTLFAHANPNERLFASVLARYHGGVEDEATTTRL
jgi:uncharacterized protein (DUF1810 family)